MKKIVEEILITFVSGARQLVVRLPAETTSSSDLYSCSLTPTTNMGASSLYPAMITFFAPASWLSQKRKHTIYFSTQPLKGNLMSHTPYLWRLILIIMSNWQWQKLKLNLDMYICLFLVYEFTGTLNNILRSSVDPRDKCTITWKKKVHKLIETRCKE